MSHVTTNPAAPTSCLCNNSSLVLRSFDDVDFAVPKGTVNLSLGRRLTEQNFTRNEGTSIICLPYSSRTLDTLLRLCYVVEVCPIITDTTEIRQLIEASIDMGRDSSTQHLRTRACEHLSKLDPVGVYALAIYLGWDDVARAAATHACAARSVSFDSLELERIPASVYVVLRRHIQSHGSTTLYLTPTHTRLTEKNVPGSVLKTSVDSSAPQPEYRVPALFDFSQSGNDVRLKSSDGFVFHTRKATLSSSSPFFAEMFSLPQCTETTDSNHIIVDETAMTIEALLRFLYPIKDPDILDIESLRALLRAGIKYDMEHIVNRAKQVAISTFIPKMPLRVYAIACLPDILLDDLAAAAARAVLAHDFEDLDAPELCEIEASSYRRLERYVNACRSVVPHIINASTNYRGEYSISWLSVDQIAACLAPSAGYQCQCAYGHIICANWSRSRVPYWFMDYLRVAENVLKKRPGDVKAAVMPPPAICTGSKIGKFYHCNGCRSNMTPPTEFNKALIAELDCLLNAVNF